MKPYSWAKNATKLQRAIAKSESKEGEDVKAIYVSMGGLVEGSETDSQDMIEVSIDETVEKVSNEEAPKKKRGRPSKK